MNPSDEGACSATATNHAVGCNIQPNELLTYSSDEDSDISIVEIDYGSRRCRRGNEDLVNNNGHTITTWFDPLDCQPMLQPFTIPTGPQLPESVSTELDFYMLMVSEDIFVEIAEQTNIYAGQLISRSAPSWHLSKWQPTRPSEIKKLFGLIIWMGLVKLPAQFMYWSTDELYKQELPSKVMSRNRFEILLQMLHFANNDEADHENRVYKIESLILKLKENFKSCYNPPETVCVDESIIQFRGRIIFRQYVKQKHHRYGLKVFKLCFDNGYTYDFDFYCGKELGNDKVTPTSVATQLCTNLFNKGHTVYMDSWYNSIDLAHDFINKNTHVFGTIRSNRKKLSTDVVKAKLRRGQVRAKENENGITLLKWRDKRDVLMISTKHSNQMGCVQIRGQEVIKPYVILEYNKAKCAVDISDQLAAYGDPLRKTLKWYKKSGFSLLFNTSIVNACILYNIKHDSDVPINKFRENLVNYLCDTRTIALMSDGEHELQKLEGTARKVRKRCSSCYQKNATNFGTEYARHKSKRVVTFCNKCEGRPILCTLCFQENHNVI